jgi:hypothetical protein
VDAACAVAGRDPGSVARTVAVLVRFSGGTGRTMGDTSERMSVEPLAGDSAVMADGLRAYAAAGIDEVQLVLDPVTRESVAALQPVLRRLDDER